MSGPIKADIIIRVPARADDMLIAAGKWEARAPRLLVLHRWMSGMLLVAIAVLAFIDCLPAIGAGIAAPSASAHEASWGASAPKGRPSGSIAFYGLLSPFKTDAAAPASIAGGTYACR